jgi:site-specific DNA recombinase
MLSCSGAGRLIPWTSPPYGYRIDPRQPRDPAGVRVEGTEAARVREIFCWYVEDGLTIYAIAQRLTAQGLTTARGHAVWTPATVRRILGNASYSGMAFGNRTKDVPATRRHPLLGGATKGAGGTSTRVRPADEWIGVPVPAIISADLFTQAQARLARNRTWAMRNTRHD